MAQETATRVSPLLGALLCALLISAAPASNSATPASNSPAVAAPPLTVWLRQIVEYLAGPECAGRRTGEPGAELAAQFIESELEIIGVEPLPQLDGYRQEFMVTRGIKAAGMPTATFDGTPLTLGTDYALAPFCGGGHLADAPVLFLGYGIYAPELNWDDYAGQPTEGAVGVIIRGEPAGPDGQRSLLGGDQPSVYSDLRRKASAAKAHGIVALLVVEDIPADAPDVLPEIRPAWGGSSSDLPVLHVRRWVVEAAVAKAAGHSISDLASAMAGHRMSASSALEAKFSLDLDVEKEQLPAWNIVGVIPGSDPVLRDEYVVIGAHYDHLGIGGPESLAPAEYGHEHWGADDNASGVAAVLANARVWREWRDDNPQDAPRSLLVVLFSGEEIGLVGSNWFVEHPPVPLSQIKLMLNFDMVGRLRDNKLTLGGTGTASEFPQLLDIGDDVRDLVVVQEETGFGGSDHMSFIQKGVPSLFFFTGAHPEYHTPRDTPDKVNYEGIGEVARFAGNLLVDQLGPDPISLAFVKPTVAPPTPGKSRGNLKVTLGTIPDYSKTDVKGMAVADVVPGGPGALAGILPGDIIVKIGGVDITNIYDFMTSLQDKNPGEVVPVVIRRDGTELTVEVTLGARNVQQ